MPHASNQADNSGFDRRTYLGLIGAGTTAGIAGCSGEDDATTTTETDDGSGSGTDSEDSSDSSGDSGGIRGGHLRVSVTPQTTTINPVMMPSKFTQRWGVKLFYSTLTRLSPSLDVYGDLAEDWSANDAADEWTFSLRDAQFHNGDEVTAEDVKATFETVYDESVGSPGRGTMGEIDSVEVIDDKTVTFHLGQKNSDFHRLVSKGWGSIVPADIVTDPEQLGNLGSEEHGSGAFILEEFSPGSSLTGVRNENYYRDGEDGEPLPYVDKVTQRTIPEYSNQVNALRSGDVDLLWQPGYSKWSTLQDMDGVSTYRTPGGEFANFIMNTDAEPWSDPRVRKAVMWAVNREAIIDGVQDGLGTIGQDSPLSPAYQFHADVGARDQDIERAKELLADAGYPDGIDLGEEFDMQLYTASIPHMEGTAIMIQEQLKQIGITFDVQVLSYEDWLNNHWGKSPLQVSAYGMRISGANFMKLLLHSEGGWNEESDWSNADFDSAVDNAIEETDPDQKQEYMREAQQIVRDEGPYAITFYTDTIAASGDYVKNYQLNPLAYQFYADEYALSSDAPTRT